MKRLKLALLLLLIPLCCVAFAALSKTTSIVQLHAWQKVLPGTLFVGDAGDISDSYDTILYLEIAYADLDAQDGVEVIIEVSYGDDNWSQLFLPFTTPSGSGSAEDTLDGAVTAGDTTIDFTIGLGFDTPGQKFFIEDTQQPQSESVRIKSETAGTITLCHDLIRSHSTGETIWDEVHEYVFSIPTSFAYVRVLINNTDANADIFYTTRLSKVTSL